MPEFVRVRDTTTGHEFDVSPRVAAKNEKLEPIEGSLISGDFVRPRPATPAPDAGAPAPGEMPMPARGASKDAWAEYAVTRGMSLQAATDASRDDLADTYNPKES